MESNSTVTDARARWNRLGVTRSEAGFAAVLSAAFFILLLVQVWNHIMWRDELRPWQIIRECSTPSQVIQAMRFDAVPPLWNFIIFGLTRISDNPFLMQFTHVVIATALIFVVAGWAPFSRTSKVMFALGYYPFFEYATIARNYSLVFLLVMIACALISRKRVRWIALGSVLFLLAQVSIWGAGLAGLLGLAAAAQAWLGPAEDRPGLVRVATVAGIVLLGGVLSYLSIQPGPGASFTDAWRNVPWPARIQLSIGSLYRAWAPIPGIGEHFWNTNVLDGAPLSQAVLGMIMMAGAMGVLLYRPVALAWLTVASGALVLFTLLKFKGNARHDGMLFIVLMAAWWLAETGPRREIPVWPVIARMSLDARRRWAMTLVLTLGTLGGLLAATQGMIHPFSATPAVADYIRREIPASATLVAHTDYCSAPISHWLDRPIYSVAQMEDIRCNTQDDSRRIHSSKIDGLYILNTVYQILIERQAPVLLMLNSQGSLQVPGPLFEYEPGPNEPMRQLHLVEISNPSFQYSVVQDEEHRLYMVRLPP